jgi:hypothetical protein
MVREGGRGGWNGRVERFLKRIERFFERNRRLERRVRWYGYGRYGRGLGGRVREHEDEWKKESSKKIGRMEG